MITGLYSAASGMIVQEKVQDVLAQNLAGSQMPGYAREEVVIRSFPDVLLSETYHGLSTSTNKPRFNHAIGRVGTGAGIDWTYVNHQPGQAVYTGNETDISLFGDGYFSVLTPDGTRYTRSGNFHVDNHGHLVTSQGYYVLGNGVNNGNNPTPIHIGNNSFHVNEFGEIFIQQPDQNNIMQDTLLDQIQVVDFKNKDLLCREEGNCFRVEEGDQSNFTVPDRFQVAQGYIEKSNTVTTTEMIKLIDSYRIHEASSRVIRALDQTLQKAVNNVAG